MFHSDLNSNQTLIDFCNALEAVCIETVESGKMTKGLAVCIHGNKVNHDEQYLYTKEFLDAIDENLKKENGNVEVENICEIGTLQVAGCFI